MNLFKSSRIYFILRELYFAYFAAKEKYVFEKECKQEFLFLRNQAKGRERFRLNWEDRWLWNDKTADTTFDTHYVYHLAWAARIIKQTRPNVHIDIGSYLYFPAMLSAFVPVEFYDYRPANLRLDNLKSLRGDLSALSFADNSIDSLSCMHVLDHPGLGRYGDPLDYDGDLNAMRELQRVLAVGGNFLFVVPIGKPKIKFNASRIFSYHQIIQCFDQLELVEFSLIPDNALEIGMLPNATALICDQQEYGCGCFWFTKK